MLKMSVAKITTFNTIIWGKASNVAGVSDKDNLTWHLEGQAEGFTEAWDPSQLCCSLLR